LKDGPTSCADGRNRASSGSPTASRKPGRYGRIKRNPSSSVYSPTHNCDAAAPLPAFKPWDEAFAVAQRTEERFWESELHRLRGELQLLAGGPSAPLDAESAFLEAAEIARAQGARLLALRAAVSLGRLWRQRGKTVEARHVVTEAREEITGGGALADMVEATTLLSELAC
jgi:hypothetical protein